ncbi:TetR/AcrR family transcriptional regulator [Sphingomonas sp. ac-8]|uniref:TetR/AcrR family transcriptional regulator n=1 Tax=Sphingomonas sp. ac-8 TaxID=3242977 RepID=UPI003A80A8F2
MKCGERRGAGRPTREEAAAINDRVLEGARAAFCRQGISGASMDEIAIAVGVTKHTIYRRYPSKAALLEAVVERDLSRFEDEMRSNAEAECDGGTASDPVAALKQATQRFFQCCITPEDVAFLSFLQAEGAFSEDMRRKLLEWERVANAPLRERIEDAQAAGCLRDGDPARICEVLVDLIDGGARRSGCTECESEASRAQFDDRWDIFARAMLQPC